MGTGRAKKIREQKLETAADTAVNNWQPTELEKMQSDRVTGFLKDWDAGKDVKDISYLNPYMNLFEGAKNRRDSESLGGGLLNMSSDNAGTNNMAAAMREQNQFRREEEASGQLYNTANAAHGYASGTLAPSLMNMENQRMQGKAEMANRRYETYLGRPKSPNPVLQAIGLGLSAASLFK